MTVLEARGRPSGALGSLLTSQGQFMATADVPAWIEERRIAQKCNVVQTPLEALPGWRFQHPMLRLAAFDRGLVADPADENRGLPLAVRRLLPFGHGERWPVQVLGPGPRTARPRAWDVIGVP